MERSTPTPKQVTPVTTHEQPRREPTTPPRRSLRVETLEEHTAPTVLWGDCVKVKL